MRTLKKIQLLLLLLFPILMQAQDIEAAYQQLKSKLEGPALKISGALHASLLSNYSNTDIRRVDPFAWRLNGQLNFDFYGVKVPVSLLMSSRSTVFNYQLPAYHFVGISPSYKWAKLHLGNSNVNFSPYVFAGQSFSGVGAEFSPGIWRVKAIQGTLQRADLNALRQLHDLDLPFSRQAWGVQGGVDSGKEKLLLSILKAKDHPRGARADSISLNPMENLVVGLNGRKQISPILYLDIDYAWSFLTRNTDSPIRATGSSHWLALGLLPFRHSTGSYKALKTSIGVKTNFGHIEVHHEKIDPGYRSLGTLFFNDDLENITISSTLSAFKKKLKIAAHLGIQRNNLSGFESNSQNRWIGTLNASFLASQKLNLNANYSNFSATNRLRFSNDPLQVLDSIKLVLVNQQLSLSGNYRIDETGTSSLSAQFSAQQANSIENEEVQRDQQNSYYMGQVSYMQQIGPHPITLNASLLINSFTGSQGQNTGISPSLSLVIPLKEDKIKWTTSGSYLHQMAEGFKSTKVFNWQNRMSFKWSKKQQLSVQAGLIVRASGQAIAPASFIESRGRVSYSWRF
ncbi:MAG: hypothetical protein KTR30_19930 [Saprospiraceae bacterium]|nr:hypothetical protein [Saprospiraceae bacterium]